MAARVARGPDGREWVVRSYRFRRPPWRTVGSGLEEDLGCFGGIIALPLIAVVSFFTVLVIPLASFLLEAPVVALWSLLSGRRWIEAAHAGPPPSRMTWRIRGEYADAVLDQVTRQLELGFERIQPHNADFVGFG